MLEYLRQGRTRELVGRSGTDPTSGARSDANQDTKLKSRSCRVEKNYSAKPKGQLGSTEIQSGLSNNGRRSLEVYIRGPQGAGSLPVSKNSVKAKDYLKFRNSEEDLGGIELRSVETEEDDSRHLV